MDINTYDGRLKNSNIPFINLSKENLILIYDSLEAEQAGNMLFKLTEYLYQGIEPSFETKIENSVWNNIMLLINRKADGYFVKASVARENGKKGGRPKKSALQEITTTEVIEDNKENNIEDMGNLTNIVIVDGKAMIKEPVIETRSYSKAQIETIKQKLIDKNTPKQEPVTTTLEKPELSFQDFVNEYKYQIDDIIKDFADGTRLRRIQGEERLKSVINSRTGRYYKKQLMALIENNVSKLTA